MPMESYTYYDEVVKASLSDMGLQFLVFCGRRMCLPLCRLYELEIPKGNFIPKFSPFPPVRRPANRGDLVYKKSLFQVQ
jgi:hypothetical protein